MLHVGVSELTQAFKSHSRAYAADANPLVLFYAAECGLKAAYMRRNNVKTTSTMTDVLSSDGHNLMFWAKELRIGKPVTQTAQNKEVVTNFKLKRDSTSHTIRMAHEAWRYGAQMVAGDESNLVAWLTAVVGWINQELAI